MRLLLPICLFVLIASVSSTDISLLNFLEKIVNNNSTHQNITLPCNVFNNSRACMKCQGCFWNSTILACHVPQNHTIFSNVSLSASPSELNNTQEYIRNGTGSYFLFNNDGNTTIYDHNQVNSTGYFNDQVNNTETYNSTQVLNQFSNSTWSVNSQEFSDNNITSNQTLDHVNWYFQLYNQSDFTSNVTAPDIQWSDYRPNNGSTVYNFQQEWTNLSVGDINNATQIVNISGEDNSTDILSEETVNTAYEFVLNTTNTIATNISDASTSYYVANQTQVAWQNKSSIILVDGNLGNSTNNSSSIYYNGTDSQVKSFIISEDSTVVESSSLQNSYFVFFNPTTSDNNTVSYSANFIDKYTAPHKEIIPKEELQAASISCSNLIDQMQCQLNGCIWKNYHKICLSVKQGSFVETMLGKNN